ncbi:MAG: PrsW family intramembrane metalloprotease [Mycobacteriaceae bacterium]|uniref:PrsW family intramembrane metalloprotease n=1 Tax=Corynebacterium sp. TaxID=1720 RepID=UPI003F9B9759
MPPSESRDGWRVVDVPRAFHLSFPKHLRPALRPTWDVFGWSFAALTVLGQLVAAVVSAGFGIFPGAGPLGVAVGYMVVFLAVTWFLLSRLLIYRGTPWLLAAAAILWGMTGAFLIGAFTVSAHLIEVSYSWDVPEIALSLGGAYPEELAKGLGVWLLLHLGRAWWNRPWHGLVAGVLIGIGFEAFENMGYALSLAPLHASSDLAGTSEMWLLRIVAGPLLHAVCTGLVGYGIGMAVFGGGLTRLRRLAWVLSGGLAGFFVHFGWNLQMSTVPSQLVTMGISWACGTALLVTAIVLSTREARGLAAAGLYPAVTVYQRIPAVPRQPFPGQLPGQGPGWSPGPLPPGHHPQW